jgi:uncharacterized protein
VTIFSAKNYQGDFDNDAAVMNVDQDLMCKFITFKGEAKKSLARTKLQAVRWLQTFPQVHMPTRTTLCSNKEKEENKQQLGF